MYAEGDSWQSWMKDFRFGTLVFVPEGPLKLEVDKLRFKFDAISARTSMAHITLTQPFAKNPSHDDIRSLIDIFEAVTEFEITIGPVIASPNKKLIWLDVSPKEKILALRDRLHDSGQFRTDLPLTKGFIPHMTISEAARGLAEVAAINEKLNFKMKISTARLKAVSWIIPNEDFEFKACRTFELS